METTTDAELRKLREENAALRQGISLMHRRAQRSEGAGKQLDNARRSFMRELSREKLRICDYEQRALQDKANYQKHLRELLELLEELENEGLVARLMRWAGLR